MTTTETTAPPHPPRRRYCQRLDSIESCRRELARLAREMVRGERDSLAGYRCCAVVQMVAKLLESTELERRLDALETKLARSFKR